MSVVLRNIDSTGFNFFPKSPRYLSVEAARDLALRCADGVAKVALLVNPDDEALDALTAQVPIDMIHVLLQMDIDVMARVRDQFGPNRLGLRD